VKLRLAHLYPKLMNIYGDRGNIMCFERRCKGREIEFQLDELSIGDAFDPGAYDLVFIGGAQDAEQRRVADDLRDVKGETLREYVEGDGVLLAVCGGYQLLGAHYRSAEGEELPGVGLLDLWTEHPGAGAKRFIVGFENHGGRTYLGPQARPLGSIVTGFGNNGDDGGEGAVYRNVFGTYLHGSLLPKNPRFADHLIALALAGQDGDVRLAALDDMVEEQAHSEALRLATRRSILRRGG